MMDKITIRNSLVGVGYQGNRNENEVVTKALSTTNIPSSVTTTQTQPSVNRVAALKTHRSSEYMVRTSNNGFLSTQLLPQNLSHKTLTEFEARKLSEVLGDCERLRLSFRKSHTCGSLFANCSCSTPSSFDSLSSPSAVDESKCTVTSIGGDNLNSTDNIPKIQKAFDRSSLVGNDTIGTEIDESSRNNNSYSNSNDRSIRKSSNTTTNCHKPNDKKTKKLFQSYSHPDTAFVFTDENKNPSIDGRNTSTITTKGGKFEIKYQKRLSSPNIGNYAILDVAVHPEILVKISTKNDCEIKKRNSYGGQNKKSALCRDNRNNLSSDSENSFEIICDNSNRSESISGLDVRENETDNDNSLRNSIVSDYERRIESNSYLSTKINSTNNGENLISSAVCDGAKSTINQSSENCKSKQVNALLYGVHDPKDCQSNSPDPARKFFQESGILGPIGGSSACLIRRTSKIVQDPSFFEQIRKNSKLLRQPAFDKRKTSNGEEFEYARSVIPNIKMETANPNTDRDIRIKSLEEDISNLKDVIRSRDSEIYKLKREIHKLKSVLQQTTHSTPIGDGDLLTSLQTHHGMAGQRNVCAVVDSPKKVDNNNIDEQHADSETERTEDSGEYCGVKYDNDSAEMLKNQLNSQNSGNGNFLLKNLPKFNPLAGVGSGPVMKKQGVSGESSDAASQHCHNVPIPKYDKDFTSKQLIKYAIMDNDFLKNIDSSQVRELVESMYNLEVAKGEYVIREGDAGAHLYVSAGGEFEVIKNGKVLGTMGPGKAFGELAILYNCTRTASIRVLSKARVWVLDRRVFQQIMMRTGMQRIEDNIKFLRSVPLLKNLSNDVLMKIADVLEVEFYPAGTYIIRQGASGDTFFLISQGTVQVTQRAPNASEDNQIRILTRGDYFGEQALINEDKRTANIIALSPGVECLTLDRESFTHLIGDLCELKEKDYGDEIRVLSMKSSEKTEKPFESEAKPELLDINLTDLEIITTLGIGGFGRVELVKCLRNGKMETYALKCLKKRHIIDTRQEEHVFSERTIMLSCRTPFICRLYRTFRDSKYVYMLLEACMGGEVWTILRDRGCFDESTTQFIVGCVLQAFEYLHTRGIIYRDLKPENLMLNERGYVKLVDFGFAKCIGHSNKTWTFCGTPEYVAPEIILNKGHDRAVDYWALGILIHELLNGTPPFTANDPMKTYNIILKGIDMVDFPKHMSRSAVMLIKRLCRDVPAERLGYQRGGIQDIKKHKWFQGFDWDGLSNLTMLPPFLRSVSHQLDTSYFDNFAQDREVVPDEESGWDEDF